MKRFLENLRAWSPFVSHLWYLAVLTVIWWFSINVPIGIWGLIPERLGSESFGSAESYFGLVIMAIYFLSFALLFFSILEDFWFRGDFLPTALGFVVGRFERFLDWISEDWEKAKETFQETRAEAKGGKITFPHWFSLFLVLLWAGFFVEALFTGSNPFLLMIFEEHLLP